MGSFWEGALAGYGIAMPVGAIAILIVELGLRSGFRPAFMAGAGAATADLLYAMLAALAGTVIAAWLAPFSLPLRLASGLVLCLLGGWGFWRTLSCRRQPAATTGPAVQAPARRPGRVYAEFLGLTLLNPLTVAYFGALILGRGAAWAAGGNERVAFVMGAGLASLSWQSLLAGLGAVGHRQLSPRWRVLLSAAGNLVVIALGLRILLLVIR